MELREAIADIINEAHSIETLPNGCLKIDWDGVSFVVDPNTKMVDIGSWDVPSWYAEVLFTRLLTEVMKHG